MRSVRLLILGVVLALASVGAGWASTPGGLAALERYNAGDDVGAIAILDRLRAADDRARTVRVDIESAAEARRIAALALDARDKGKFSTLDIIDRYEEIVRPDPGAAWDWINLARLDEDAGQLAAAAQAAKAAAGATDGDRDRIAALNKAGDVLSAQGDLAGARKAYEETLDIARKLAAADPSSAQAQRDLAVSLRRAAMQPGSSVRWSDVAAQWRLTLTRGQLAPTDQFYLDEAERRAKAEANP